jgi:uncharacterized protein YhfF
MNKKLHPSLLELWNYFMLCNQEHKNTPIPESYYFCDNEKDANTCAQLVLDGVKRATSTSMWWFETYKQPLPKIGDLAIVTDWDGIAKAVIETVKIEMTPFNEVTAEYAKIEGEGDKSLTYWNKVHWDYYTREMMKRGEQPSEDMILVCEYFRTVCIKD